MKKVIKSRLAMSAVFLVASSVSYGQAAPAGVVSVTPNPSVSGFNFLSLDGQLHYALSASEIVQFGYYGPGDVTSSSILSGNVAYSSKSVNRPFSLLFAGGIILPNQGGQGVTGFESASVSQGFTTRHWAFNIADTVSFLPQSPTTGLSGIPGVGDIGVIPIQGAGSGPAGGILSVSGNRISNVLSGGASRQINRGMSIGGSGSWAVLHFLSNAQGLNNTQASGAVSLSQRLDARSSASVSAIYSAFNYSGPEAGALEPNFQSKGINLGYQRTINRAFSVSGSVGPQWVSSSNSNLIPTSLSLSAMASLAYTHRFTNASLFYSRGINAGSGVLPGAVSDTVGFAAGRSFGRNWAGSLNAGYARSKGLTQIAVMNSFVPVNAIFHTVFGGVQVTRRISSNLSGYASYTLQDQSTNYPQIPLSAENALSGTSQTFGIGITFTPRSTRLGQF
jgi:hypothetical protein